MNSRRNGLVRVSGAATGNTELPISPASREDHAIQKRLLSPRPLDPQRPNSHREGSLLRDSLHILEKDGIVHVISEDYSYKTEPYYTILDYELRGKVVRPSSSAVLDAYIVPMCLERAKLAGIPVAEWGISQGFVPLPSVIYGLNYFATSAEYFLVRDGEKAKEVIAHVTNKGKYPFCYQRIPPDAAIHSCVSVFGRTAGSCSSVAGLAQEIYRIFSLPLVTMVFVKSGDTYRLSSLSPARYTRISTEERALLSAYLARQEFL